MCAWQRQPRLGQVHILSSVAKRARAISYPMQATESRKVKEFQEGPHVSVPSATFFSIEIKCSSCGGLGDYLWPLTKDTAPSQKETSTHACWHISHRSQRQKHGRMESRFHMQCASQILNHIGPAWGPHWIKILIQEIQDRPEGPHFQQTHGQCWPPDHALGHDGSAC